ncbi:PREDICTED: uncharacterized protein LOC18602755 isoform X2 [Theobroma cacao]|uniref:Uncharacterized protein LOC18602755 isoform X2 n=1 Tax=Theobroma cacao TaxID=3641 RepID=A0AB32W8P7_THECC|nr:PREDICTED: uncharacterized protein LOC18602755 isoform X2 [Theobroma cacao]
MNSKQTPTRVFGQYTIASTFLSRSSNFSEELKEDSRNKDSKKFTSLSDFLNRKLPRSSGIPKTVQFKQDSTEKVDCMVSSGGVGEEEEKEETSRKRQNPFEGLVEEHRTRRPFLVLGDDPPKPKKRGRRECSLSNKKPKPHYNHYANGCGWWDCDMEGVDSEEVGSGEVWEGVGSTTFGGIVDWH